MTETQYERNYLGSKGVGAVNYAPTATSSSSKAVRAGRDPLAHALNDMNITMRANRGDLFGLVSSCELAACETLQEIKDRTKVMDIFGPQISGMVNMLESNGMAVEIAFLKGLYNGLFTAVPDDHKVRDPEAGVLRTALGMAADITGVNFLLKSAFGAEDGLFTRTVTLDSGQVFSRAVQQEGSSIFYQSGVLTKLDKLEEGGKEKFLTALENYGEQLDRELKKRYGALDENQRKTVLKSIGSEIGYYITSHGVRPAMDGEEPGVYLKGITLPAGENETEGKPINLNNPRDVGRFINMLTGPKISLHPIVSLEKEGPNLKIPDAAPELSNPSAPVVAPNATETNTPTQPQPATPLNGNPQVAAGGETNPQAAPTERRDTLIIELFDKAGITPQEMLQLLGLMGKDDRFEATTRTNPATGDETTAIKIFDAAGNEKTIDKNGVDQKVPPEQRGTDKELTLPELRMMLAEKMLEPEKENNLAVALQRRETANMMDITLNRLDTDTKTIAAALCDGVAVGEGKDHPVTFVRADGQTVTVSLKEYLNENPKKVDALADVVIQQVIQAIPDEKRAEAFGIKEVTSTSIVEFDGGRISTRPAQTLNEYLAQHPEAVEKASYQILVEREKSRAAEAGVSPEQPPLTSPTPPQNDIASTLKDLAKGLGLQVHAAHHDTPAPDIVAPGKATERLGKEGGSGGGRAGGK
jgi:hypothetical protein